MYAKPVEIYQGSDWLTYRWSVAQAFDTLDRIRDLCQQMPVAAVVSSASAGTLTHYEVQAEDIADIFGYIVELCDDLTGEMDTAHADLSPALQNNMTHLWMAFEMHLHLRDLRMRAVKDAESEEPATTPPDAIMTLATRIKTLLKQIDQ